MGQPNLIYHEPKTLLLCMTFLGLKYGYNLTSLFGVIIPNIFQ